MLKRLVRKYEKDGNVVKIYNSYNVCSLVINEKVVDRYIGAVAFPFCLKGEIDNGDKKIIVKAKMGLFNMRLYYDDKLIDKKFMGMG